MKSFVKLMFNSFSVLIATSTSSTILNLKLRLTSHQTYSLKLSRFACFLSMVRKFNTYVLVYFSKMYLQGYSAILNKRGDQIKVYCQESNKQTCLFIKFGLWFHYVCLFSSMFVYLSEFFPFCSFIKSCSFIVMVKIMFHIRLHRA